jgi:hypothetical protein
VIVNDASVDRLAFTGCELPGVSVRNARLRHGLELDGSAVGEVDLSGSTVDGTVSLRDCSITGVGAPTPSLRANFLDAAAVDCRGIVANGGVSLIGARAHRTLTLTGAEISRADGWALDMQGFTAGYGVFLGTPRNTADGRAGMVVVGGVRMPSLTAPLVVLDDADLRGGRTEEHRGPFSLYAYGVKASELHLDSLRSTDAVDLTLAQVEQGIYMRIDRAGAVVDLSHVRVPGELRLGHLGGDGATEFRLRGAAVADLHVDASLNRTSPLDLSDSRIGTLHDDPRRPAMGARLSGASISRVADLGSAVDRMAWLAAANERAYGSYRLLADLFRRDADHSAAARLLIEGRRRRRRHMNRAARTWSCVRDLTSGYGHRMWRLGAILATAVVVCASVLDRYATATPVAAASGDFQPLVFAVDAALPGVSLGQEDGYALSGPGVPASWAIVLLGYVLTTLLIAALVDRLREE